MPPVITIEDLSRTAERIKMATKQIMESSKGIEMYAPVLLTFVIKRQLDAALLGKPGGGQL